MQKIILKSALFGVVVSLMLFFVSGISPVAAQQAMPTEYCFGAAGQGCGGWNSGEMPRVAFCVDAFGFSKCKVSGGSLAHDPCCASNPRGKMCGGTPENTSTCSVSWDRAVSRAFWGYQWTRAVDTKRGNATGVVERALYCAKKESRVHRNDAEFCCSRKVRSPWDVERIGRPDLKICE